MRFQEPIVEFISIDFGSDIYTASVCTTGEPQESSGVNYCECTDGSYGGFSEVMVSECDNPGVNQDVVERRVSGRSVKKKDEPKNIVGFDMTFDK